MNFEIIKNIIPFLWPKNHFGFRIRVIIAFLSLIFAKVFTVLIPISLIWVVDSFEIKSNQSNDWFLFIFGSLSLVIIYNIFRILSVGFTQLRDAVFALVGQNALRKIAVKAFSHIHSLSLSFHLTRKTGAISRIVERGVIGTEFILRFLFFNIIPLIFEFILVIIILVYKFEIVYTLIVSICLILYSFFTFKITEWRVSIRKKMNQFDSDSNQKAIDGLLNYETVKYFNAEKYEMDRYNFSRKQYQKAAVKTSITLAFLNLGQTIIITTGLMTIMILAMKEVNNGNLTLGSFVGLNAIIIQLSVPLNFLGTVYREIRQALVDLEAMFEIFSQKIEIKDKNDAKKLNITNSDIEFNDVHFSYNPDRLILSNFSLQISKGTQIAIVGKTGSGKSTIARLLFRFYDPQQGDIYIDKQKISDVTLNSLHQNIGVVPQDTVLFNDTILYNLKYGNQNANFDQIQSAAKSACIDDFINSLPNGYNTMVGERGLKLSGGEKQRIGIARTILKDASIMLLDESTSSLDYTTEKKILANLKKDKKNSTMIVISHRLSAITDVDKIIVLNFGKIIEQGTHLELMNAEGEYFKLWQNQDVDMIH
ncbi:MAG: ABC transporter ATP-binding protein/permease [Pseudomonadota bacterium]|nr:ABC transporter ATP-binding protein/permease [Pseudomonadota bacterium]